MVWKFESSTAPPSAAQAAPFCPGAFARAADEGAVLDSNFQTINHLGSAEQQALYKCAKCAETQQVTESPKTENFTKVAYKFNECTAKPAAPPAPPAPANGTVKIIAKSTMR